MVKIANLMLEHNVVSEGVNVQTSILLYNVYQKDNGAKDVEGIPLISSSVTSLLGQKVVPLTIETG